MNPKKHRLLIVDDDEAILDSLEDILFKRYAVKKAYNGYDALKILSEDKNFDLLILDIMMPDLDGFELVKEIKNQEIDIPFIFLTAKVNIEDKVEGLKLGADDYIIKPFEKDELLLRLERKLIIENKIKIRNKRLMLMNHNIFNPINSASGFLEILENKLHTYQKSFMSAKMNQSYVIPEDELIDFFKSSLESTKKVSESLHHLIKTTRNLSEIFNPIDLQLYKNKVSLKLLIYDILVLSKPKALACELNNTIPDIQILVDRDKIIKIFYEILDNAYLHNHQSEKQVKITIEEQGKDIVFSITDNGTGIEPSDITHVFDEFWSGADMLNHSRGEGLGLWISKKYIEAHNGKIWVDKENSSGTTIKISLPKE